MTQSKILLTDVEIPVHDNLISTSISLNTNSPSNSDILNDYEEINEIAKIPVGSGSLFPDDPAQLPKIKTLGELLRYLSEIMIRFNSSPSKYKQDDFAVLIKMLTNSLIYLYTDGAGSGGTVNSGIPFIGKANLLTNPSLDALNLGNTYKGIYLASREGNYTNFGTIVSVSEYQNSLVVLVPNYTNGNFQNYSKQTIVIDLSNKLDKADGESLMTDAEHIKLETIAENADVNLIEKVTINGSNELEIINKTIDLVYDHALSTTSENPVQNKAITEKINLILGAIVEHPVYTAPSASINLVNKTVERGSNVSENITHSFSQNDAGALTTQELLVNEVASGTSNPQSLTINNITSSKNIKGKISYEQGVLKQNNLGEDDPVGRINAGFIYSPIKTITVSKKIFYGNAAVVPDNSTDIRLLPQFSWEGTNSVILNTGNTNVNFILVVPENKQIGSVIDLDNSNANVTNFYTLRKTLVVADAGGNTSEGENPFNYRLYAMTSAIPYSSNKRHQITLI